MLSQTSIPELADLTRRWREQLTLLHAQANSAPAITVESTRGRLRKLYDDAQVVGASLPKPSFDDPAFTEMTFSRDVAQEVIAFATEEAKRVRRKKLLRKYKERYAAKIAAAPNIKHKPHIPRIGPNDCCCGWGEKVTANRRFRLGHNQRWLDWMRRIERGEMPRESLNPILQEWLRWTKCSHCGGWVPTTDALGQPMTNRIGFDCQRRAKQLQRAVEKGLDIDPRLLASLSGNEAESSRWRRRLNETAYDDKQRAALGRVGPKRRRQRELVTLEGGAGTKPEAHVY